MLAFGVFFRILAGLGLFGLAAAAAAWRGDAAHREVTVGDGRNHAIRQGDGADMHTFTGLNRAEIEFDALGMALAGQVTSIARRTIFNTPPVLIPGQVSSFKNTTGISTVT